MTSSGFFLGLTQMTILNICTALEAIAVNLISATIIFGFIWFFRKKPTFDVQALYHPYREMIGTEEAQFYANIYFNFTNKSSYRAFDVRITDIVYPFNFKKPIETFIINTDETEQFHIYIETEKMQGQAKQLSFERDKFYKDLQEKEIQVKATFKNEDNRKFLRTYKLKLYYSTSVS